MPDVRLLLNPAAPSHPPCHLRRYARMEPTLRRDQMQAFLSAACKSLDSGGAAAEYVVAALGGNPPPADGSGGAVAHAKDVVAAWVKLSAGDASTSSTASASSSMVQSVSLVKVKQPCTAERIRVTVKRPSYRTLRLVPGWQASLQLSSCCGWARITWHDATGTCDATGIASDIAGALVVNLCCTQPPLPPLSLWQVFLQLLLPLLRVASHEALTCSVHDGCVNTFLSQLRRWLGDKGLRGIAAVLMQLDNGDWQQVGTPTVPLSSGEGEGQPRGCVCLQVSAQPVPCRRPPSPMPPAALYQASSWLEAVQP